MEQTECSEMSAYKIQTPVNYPEESIEQIRINIHKGSNTKKHSTNNTKHNKYKYTYYQNTLALQNPHIHTFPWGILTKFKNTQRIRFSLPTHALIN